MVKSTHIVISMILVIFLLLTTTAYSERFVIQDVYEATLLSDGTLQTSLTPINAAGVVGYVCASSDCATVSGTFLPTTTTGADNSIIIEYPTTLQNPNGYGIYFYKPGYAIWEVSANWFGTTTNDPAGPFNAYLSRVEVCRSPIDTFQVINDVHPNQPIMIDVSASLDAVTRSALFHSGELDYVPPALLPYYQVETEITLTITEENSGVVHTETRTINIDFSGEELVQFTWVPTELGQYTAEVSTDVTDAKCKSSMKEYSRKQFGVIPEGPKEFCYLLLNNLSALPTHQEVGSTIGIDVTSIANYFDTLGDLHPLPAELELTVTRLGVVEHTDTLSIPVGNNINDYQTTSWNFVPSRAGEHQITVEGSYLGCPFQNGTNDVVSQSYFVLGSGRPVFLTLPNVILQKDSGLNGDLFDLDDFTSDPENDPLVFNIESETDTTVVDCSIDVDNKIDCFVKPGVVGASDVTVSVTDGTSFEYQTFTVTVNGTVTTQCSDLIDNDGDGLVDLADPGCSNPQDDDESDGTSQCQDGFDNDGDGLVDLADPGCSSPQDDKEYTPKVSECRDGIDNDGDGDIDSDDAACQRGMQHENEDPLAEEGLFISNIVLIDSNGYSSPGSLGAFSIHVRNNGASSMKNVKIVVTVPDFGLRGSAGPFTLDKGSATTRKIYMWDADVLEPGIYDARVTIYSEGSIRIKHREFVVE